jgi:peptide methionine sulfoxide reductase msrA/msrB
MSDATYERVSSGRTKHREAVKIVYDPSLVSYDELLEIYRRQVDPTDA